MGLSSAEFILPVLIVFLLTFIEWRDIWVSISILIIVILPISTYFLVKNVKLDTREQSDSESSTLKEIKHWKRIEVLKDYRFGNVDGGGRLGFKGMMKGAWDATKAGVKNFLSQEFGKSKVDFENEIL